MKSAIFLGSTGFVFGCDTNPTWNAAGSGPGCAGGGSCVTAVGSGYGAFCCHAHDYTSFQTPSQENAYAAYTFAGAVAISTVDIEQHANGIDCLRAELDGKDAGTRCVSNQGNGNNNQFGEHSISSIVGFNTSVTGTNLKLFITKTSLKDGWCA